MGSPPTACAMSKTPAPSRSCALTRLREPCPVHASFPARDGDRRHPRPHGHHALPGQAAGADCGSPGVRRLAQRAARAVRLLADRADQALATPESGAADQRALLEGAMAAHSMTADP